MRIVILGAAGKTGTHLVNQAVGAGHAVTAFVRSTDELSAPASSLRIETGDARSTKDLTTALTGQDAVISSLGSNKPGDDLIVISTKALIDAMKTTGVKRVIMMSSFLASPNFKPTGIARVISWLMRPFIKDKTSGEDLLKQSGLDWTIVYATRLDGVKPGAYRVLEPNETVSVQDSIARANVAEFMLNQLESKSTIQKSVVITSLK